MKRHPFRVFASLNNSKMIHFDIYSGGNYTEFCGKVPNRNFYVKGSKKK